MKYLYFLFFLFLISCSPSKEEIVDEFLNEMNRGDIEAAIGYLAEDFVYVADYPVADSLHNSCRLNLDEYLLFLNLNNDFNLEKEYSYSEDHDSVFAIVSEEKDEYSKNLKFNYPEYYEYYFFEDGLITSVRRWTVVEDTNVSNEAYRKIKEFNNFMKEDKQKDPDSLSADAVILYLKEYFNSKGYTNEE